MQELEITANTTTLQTTVGVSIGYQEYAQMALSLEADWIEVFGSNCVQARKNGNLTNRSCEKSPYNATNYFDESGLTPLKTYADEIYDGFVVSGNIYFQQFCLNALYGNDTLDYFCTIQPELVYVTSSMSGNYWNAGAWASAGIFGLGSYSPVWTILDASDDYQIFSIEMANFNYWTFADSSWTSTITDSVLYLGLSDTTSAYDDAYSAGEYMDFTTDSV